MKFVSVLAACGLCLALGITVVVSSAARAEGADSVALTVGAAGPAADIFNPAPETYAKKCSFSSDCPFGKCKKGRCGGCSFKSDCRGWGVCTKGWCGACSFSSDCKAFGGCSSGRCRKSPY